MRTTSPWTRPLKVAFALAFAAGLARGAKAETITQQIVYRTSGSVSTQGLTGPGAISFDSNSYGINTPQDANLGDFRVLALPAGQSATYTNTPFSITFLPFFLRGDGSAKFTPVVLNGELNGVVNGSTSNVVATFNPLDNGTFYNANGTMAALSLAGSSLSLSPTPSARGLVTVFARATSVPSSAAVPEPTSAAVILAGLAGLVVYRRRRAA